MPKKTSKNDANALHLEDQIHGAMQQEGWSIPTTPQAVQLMESRLAKAKPPLPASLAADPLSILKTPTKSIELRPFKETNDPSRTVLSEPALAMCGPRRVSNGGLVRRKGQLTLRPKLC